MSFSLEETDMLRYFSHFRVFNKLTSRWTRTFRVDVCGPEVPQSPNGRTGDYLVRK